MIVNVSGWESVVSDESDSDENSDLDDENSDMDRGAGNKTPAARVTHPQQKQGNNRAHKKVAASRKKKAPVNPYSSAELISFLTEVVTAGNMAWSSSVVVYVD
jgi:hypothetical protein